MRVIVHTGMGKAGSTAIQFWLGAQAAALDERGIVSLRDGRSPVTTSRWEPTTSGSAKVRLPVYRQTADPFSEPAQFIERVLGLDRHVDTVVVTHEFLSTRLYERNNEFLHFLREVGARFRTELLVYVRPQHAWVEAGWRQWGFRRTVPASEWIVGHSDILDYRWLARLSEQLQECSVRVHPVVDGPSGRTDVVQHFATDVLGIPDTQDSLESKPPEANSGLPLRVCAALWRDQPKGLWVDPHDNLRLEALKRLLDDELRNVDRTDAVTDEVRHVLHVWATQRFGEANEEFLAGVGWDRAGWPIPSGEHDNDVDVSQIDELLRRDLPPTAAAKLAAHVERLVTLPDADVAALI